MTIIQAPFFHSGQEKAFKAITRFFVLRCGRRYGKTAFEIVIACDLAMKGKNVGFFAPDYKILAETFSEMVDILAPIKKSASRIDGVIKTTTGGRIDFWSLENERAGRSRKYHLALIDEGAFTKPNMLKIWETAIKPSLLDYQGACIVASTPNGIDPDNFFYAICNDPKYGFTEFHAPTHDNPYLPKEELEKLERENHPLVYKQEYLAEFIDWGGEAFFSLDNLLDNGKPAILPTLCDGVYAVIDSALKDGAEHDGTAVIYFSTSKFVGHPITILDYDIIQIEGSLLEAWLPNVYRRLEELSTQCNARYGSLGAWIEDKASGIMLLQQAKRRGWLAHPIDSKLTSMGKDARCISVSGYVYQGKVKISQYAFDKVVKFKEQSRNHLLTQVTTFKIGDKNAHRRADDLLDCFSSGISIGLGNEKGW